MTKRMVFAQACAILKNIGYSFSEEVTTNNSGIIGIIVNNTHP